MLGATVVADVPDAAPIANGDQVPLERLEADIAETEPTRGNGSQEAGDNMWLRG